MPVSTPVHDLLDREFTHDTLQQIVQASLSLALDGGVPNPAAPFFLSCVFERIARRWFDGEPTTVDTALALEASLAAPARALLDAAEGGLPPEDALARFNALANAYADCVARLG